MAGNGPKLETELLAKAECRNRGIELILNEGRLLICFKCALLVCESLPETESPVLPGDAGGVSDETGAEVVQGAAVAGEGKIVIKNCTWKHIVVSASECNLVGRGSRDESNLTKLAGFLVGDGQIGTQTVSQKALRDWASALHIPNSRSMRKKKLCDAIVLHKKRMEMESSKGTVARTEEGSVIRINPKRYDNVLFGEVMKPLFQERGKKLVKEQLDAGIKPTKRTPRN